MNKLITTTCIYNCLESDYLQNSEGILSCIFLFAKLVFETRNEIIHKTVREHKKIKTKNYATHKKPLAFATTNNDFPSWKLRFYF